MKTISARIWWPSIASIVRVIYHFNLEAIFGKFRNPYLLEKKVSLFSWGNNASKELDSSLQPGNRKMQALKFFSVNELDEDVFLHIRDLANKTLSTDDIQDFINFYKYLTPLMSDFLIDRPHEEYMNFNNKQIESSKNGVYPLSRIEEVIVGLANSFPVGKNVEFGTWFTGSTDELLDQFVVPRVIGVSGLRSTTGFLTDNINRYATTLDILALRHAPNGHTHIGILLDALHGVKDLKHSRFQMLKQVKSKLSASDDSKIASAHNNLFIELKNLILPVGETLADFLTPRSRKLLQLVENENISTEELIDRLRTSNNTVTTSIRTHVNNTEIWDQYTLLQERGSPERSFDIDAYGTFSSWHPTNSYYYKTLQANKFAVTEAESKHGAFMSLHIHNAYTQDEIDLANKNGTALCVLLDAVGRDTIHTLPTPSDILHDSEISNHLKKIGLDTVNAGNLILSLKGFDTE